MVTLDLKAIVVALVFAVIFGTLGLGIRQLFAFFYMDRGEPVWTQILWLLVPAGVVGGWLLGWWLARP